MIKKKTGYIKKQNLTLIVQFTQVYSKNKQTKQQQLCSLVVYNVSGIESFRHIVVARCNELDPPPNVVSNK